MVAYDLIHQVLQVTREFHARRLWERFTNFDALGLRLPDESDLVIGSVMGDAGEQYGLMLFRGPDALETFADLTSDEGPGDDTHEAMDVVSFSMAPFAALEPETQAMYRRAGLHPRHNELAPGFLVKAAYRHPRLPEEPELRLLLTATNAVLLADDQGLLQPAELDDPGGICVITVGGDPMRPTISVSRQTLCRRSGVSGPHVFAASGLDLSGLGLLDATWLVGTPLLPAGVEGDDRSMLLLLVVDAASGMVLQAKPFFGTELQEAVAALEEAFRGLLSGAPLGVPRHLVFSSRRLHDAVAPPLRKKGARCEYQPVIPALQAVADDLLGFMDRRAAQRDKRSARNTGAQAPAPDDLAAWKEVDRRLVTRFTDYLDEDNRLWSSRAARRYFGDEDLDRYLNAYRNQGVAAAYAAWGVLHYRPTRRSKTQAEKMLAKRLPKAEAMLLQAQMDAHPSLYRVVAHNPHAGTVDMEDVLLSGTVTVHDQLLSENINDGTFLTARVYRAGQFHFLAVAGPAFNAGAGSAVVEFLVNCGLQFTPDELKNAAHVFGWLWSCLDAYRDDLEHMKLHNTDGDDILLHTASFSVADPAAVRCALLRRRDIEYDEENDEFVWLKTAGRGAEMLDEPVILGRIELTFNVMMVETNSAPRFAKAHEWLTKLPGVTLQDVTTHSVEDLRRQTKNHGAPEAEDITPAMAESLQAMLNKQYMAWLDRPIPAFEGKTPRQMCRTPEGRQRVAIQIRSIPDPAGPVPVQVPRHAMLQALGLERKTAPIHSAAEATMPLFDTGSEPESAFDTKVGRNDPCPCGSGKKYKRCCGRE